MYKIQKNRRAKEDLICKNNYITIKNAIYIYQITYILHRIKRMMTTEINT